MRQKETSNDTTDIAGTIVYCAGKLGRHVLLVKQKANGAWSFPKGSIKEGEDPEQAAIRELEEEAGFYIGEGSGISLLTKRPRKSSHTGIVSQAHYYQLPVKPDVLNSVVEGSSEYDNSEISELGVFGIAEVISLAGSDYGILRNYADVAALGLLSETLESAQGRS